MGWFKNQQERHELALEMASKAAFSSGRVYLAFDDERQEITVDSNTVNGKFEMSPKNNYRTFPYADIDSSQMYVELDERQSQGAVGATVGALIAGPAGAVIGGLARRGVDKSKLKTAGVKVRIRGDEYDIKTVLFAKTGQAQIEKVLGPTQAISDRLDAILGVEAGALDQATGGVADELAKLADLLDRGAITQEEFDAAKAKALGL
ncbi:hypothetical protein Xcel_3446 (plasmid) [Xylanimonas cellulosilytica DSM 15894]|uniref:SHOCT domain-containing protein n=1 Tax=Xylanimonas cellulosilytica (strain DSM 15894 / JCM 12276 / CECT 5975 / KCTC 9989 / LMG 20990 / NBRC 107835 / XIL07) TaxID=446471 RepID=D1C0X9_XYLCX|nr:SHOCT domain-containing protein [Xylanimonas cellulosilytica]ACZ32445.1 hypothetical protein Xcel_3446 [Xylanimonas cellulosilytica DSM 15894]